MPATAAVELAIGVAQPVGRASKSSNVTVPVGARRGERRRVGDRRAERRVAAACAPESVGSRAADAGTAVVAGSRSCRPWSGSSASAGDLALRVSAPCAVDDDARSSRLAGRRWDVPSAHVTVPAACAQASVLAEVNYVPARQRVG